MNQTASCDLLRPQPLFMGVAADNPTPSDYALARAAATGAVAAAGALYDRHSRRVYSLCFRMTRNAADAEDLTQEVFVQLLRKIGSFRRESQFTSWLYRITFNQVLMYFRKVKSLKEEITEDVEAKISASYNGKPARHSQVLDKIALDVALSQLPPGCRAVLVLFDIEGYRHEEIARLLGCSVGNSKSQLHKARMKLRRLLNSGRLKRRRAH